jgi:hypothetical protein
MRILSIYGSHANLRGHGAKVSLIRLRSEQRRNSIGGAIEAASEAGSAANQILTSAQSLSRKATALKSTVSKFLEGGRTYTSPPMPVS